MSLQVDEQQARDFLEVLDRGSETFVFQTFDDNKTRKDRLLSKVFVGSLDSVLPALNNLQQRGAGVFVQVQGGESRGQDGITYGRTVMIDSDDPEDVKNVIHQVKQELQAPSALVRSSGGKFHIYWGVEACDPAVTSSIIETLADIAGTDPSIKSPERVMRLPGSWHLKDQQSPVQVKLITAKPERQYVPHDFMLYLNHCSRRGARMATGGGTGFVKLYDDIFGLPIVDADDMDVLPSGNRTQKLVSYIGRLVNDGYSADWIENEVRRVAAERLPEGDTPITEASWQNELIPAIHRFQRKLGIDPAPQTAPVQVQSNIPGMPQQPQAQDVPEPQHTETTLSVAPPPPPYEEEVVTDRPNVNRPLEDWLEQYVWVEEGQYVVDTHRPLSSGTYTAADFDKAKRNHRMGAITMYNKWLANSFRRTVRDFTFAPGSGQVIQRDKALYLNTYELPDPFRGEFDPESMTPFEDHMHYLFEDADAFWRMMNWLIFTVQSPQTRIPWAPLLISGEGRGKTWLFELVKHMLDGKFCAAVETDELEQPYNHYMADTLLVCFEEVCTRNKHQLIDRLKPIITNTSMDINQKFGKKGQRDIYANTLMTSNHPDALALQPGSDSRRYWVYQINKPAMTDDKGRELYGWLKTQGPKQLMQWCMGVDQSTWAFNAWPEYTEAKDEMIKCNMSLVTRAMLESMEDNVGVFQMDMGDERQVEDTIAMFLDQDKLDKKQKGELKHLLRQYTRPLRRMRIGKRFVRLLVWRNEERWLNAPDDQISKEYDRCKLAALGQDPGSNLTEVRGGKT